jgi:4-amino-4-deoxy-L-arabinose transferase-like glycosyltransferase
LNALLGVLAVVGVVGLTALLFDRHAAILAGAVAAVYPGAVSMSTFVLAEAPFCPLMMGQLILWVLAWKSARAPTGAVWAVAAGAVAGLATLMRPSWLLFTPFALVAAGMGVIFVRRRGSDESSSPTDTLGGIGPEGLSDRQDVGTVLRRYGWLGLWLIAGLVTAMLPWWVRNWRVTGRFVPTTLQVGESLYDGLNPQATGASDMRFVDAFRRQLRDEDAGGTVLPSSRGSFEERLDARMRDAAIAWAMRNPGRVIQLAGVKFVRIWNIWPNEPSFRSRTLRLVLMCTYVPVLLLSLGGIWRFAGHGWPYVLCFLPAAYFTCLHVVFVGSIRYRQPAMLPLIVLAAGFVQQMMGERRLACTNGSVDSSHD